MIYIIIGLAGALLMFCGDMLLYYTPDDFNYSSGKNQNVMQAVIDVMKKLPVKRVSAGGILGPIASFLYCIGFYHIVNITDDRWKLVAWIAILSPGVLFLLKKPLRKLPKGIRVIISGGWTNLISVIYYAIVTVLFICR